jgi:hypothetical protein
MFKFSNSILYIVMSIFFLVILVTAYPIKTFTATVSKAPIKYTVVIDSGKIYKCDSMMWYRYDTLIPIPKITMDTLRHYKLDTAKIKK